MSTILLTTLNAKYIHPSLGLRSIKANMGPLYSQTKLQEFTINDDLEKVAEQIIEINPTIIGLGVYIWNLKETTELIQLLKLLLPELIIIVGGPEVSYESEKKPLFPYIDYLICGEADTTFSELCQQILDGKWPTPKIRRYPLPILKEIQLPYQEYSDDDVKNRFLYVEASRGCPFQCQFCLSSLDEKVRAVPLESFLSHLEQLWNRGGRSFKFIDRTFNLSIKQIKPILEFFLARIEEKPFIHFEMVPERFPGELKNYLIQFPEGTLQLEIGIQTFNEEVANRISRPVNAGKIEENLQFLLDHTKAHLHTDLIIGLPGENRESFGKGFDKLYSMRPHEIQVGILKRLSGTPILQYESTYKMIYHPKPPYHLLQNSDLSYQEMQSLKRFARFWDHYANSGRFKQSLELLFKEKSAFNEWLLFSEWAYKKTHTTMGLSLQRKGELLFDYLIQVRHFPLETVQEALINDFSPQTEKGVSLPSFLKRSFVTAKKEQTASFSSLNKRQQVHQQKTNSTHQPE